MTYTTQDRSRARTRHADTRLGSSGLGAAGKRQASRRVARLRGCSVPSLEDGDPGLLGEFHHPFKAAADCKR